MTINDLVLGARDRLIQAGISANLAALDAEVLARQVLGWDRAKFLADRHDSATSSFLLNYEHYVARRTRREPISYIIGTREFWSLDFEVTPDVLIPRPETELIVEEAIKRGEVRLFLLAQKSRLGFLPSCSPESFECPGYRNDISHARWRCTTKRGAPRCGG